MGWNERNAGKTTTERGYGHAWRQIRELVKSRARGLCEQCRKVGKYNIGTDCDHIKAKALGGTDALDNLQWLCRQCHEAKTARETTGGSIPMGCDKSGMPVDPGHHWAN